MSDAEFFDHYADLDLQRRMVSDLRRTRAFCQAIERVVKPEDRVLDLGCGTGILALTAARKGAQVVAIDRAQVVHHAARLGRALGYGDRIRYLMGDVRELEVDEPFDWVVSEWLGNFAFVENMWADVADARDRLLKPGGGLLPEALRLWLAPWNDPVLYHSDGPGFWNREVMGFDLSMLERAELEQGLASQIRVEPEALAARPVPLLEWNLQTAPAPPLQASGTVRFQPERPGQLHGFVGWFEVDLGGHWFSTGPEMPETHWAQTVLHCPPEDLRPDGFRVDWSLEPDPDEPRHVILRLTWGERRLAFRLE